MPSVLFVCLGNICRSPAAEGLLKHLNDKGGYIGDLQVESCGIGDWHLGQLPDERMREAAKARGIILSSRAQQFNPVHFDRFDYILAADKEVLNDLYYFAKSTEHKSKIHLITEFSRGYAGEEIPDPYYQGGLAFELVLDMLEDSCSGLLEHMQKQNIQ